MEVNEVNPALRTILVVDPFEPVLEVVRRYLQEAGYRVLTALSAEEALQTASQQQHPIDVLLSEEKMPEMSGLLLAERLRESYPKVGIVVMSSALPGNIYASYETLLGATFLWKPFTREDLLEKLYHVLEKSTRQAPHVRTGDSAIA